MPFRRFPIGLILVASKLLRGYTLQPRLDGAARVSRFAGWEALEEELGFPSSALGSYHSSAEKFWVSSLVQDRTNSSEYIRLYQSLLRSAIPLHYTLV